MVLRRIFPDSYVGFYVDIGAHHPKRFSNTYFFYQNGWTGINVEPNPRGYKSLCAIRTRDINVQLAISDMEGEGDYHMFDEPALNTFDPDLAQSYSVNRQLLCVEKTQLTTLRALLDRKKPSRVAIDFLNIDVEGLDLQVLASNDWEKYRPRIVVTESIGRSLEGVLSSEAARYMVDHGYEPFAKTVNSVFYRDLKAVI